LRPNGAIGWRGQRWPFRRQIVAWNLGILVPVALATGWSMHLAYKEELALLGTQSTSLAAAVVVYLERGLDVKSIQTVIEDIPVPPGAVITLTNQSSTVLARSVDAEQYVGRQIDAHPLPAPQVPELVQRVGVDGIDRVFANHHYDKGPWVVSVGIPTSVARTRVTPVFRRHIAVLLLVMIVTVVVQAWLLREYTSAFDRALAFTRRVAAGDLSPLEPIAMPSREMEQIQAAVIEMVDRMREAREAIAAQVVEERRIRQELESLQRQVIRQERLAAIGVLVSGVAHELNNPLQAILGFAELLQLRTDLPEDARQELALIQKESTRASAIIRNLSRFTRQQTMEPTLVRLRDVVASVIELRQRKLEEGRIDLNLVQIGDPLALAVFAELQQVVLNFVINAEQALKERDGRHIISIRVDDSDGPGRIEVRDNGPGVPQEDEAKLFQPFFTTKPVGEGTGLGLSVSYGIIESHGGTIGYRRAPDGGAIFYFELPAIAGTGGDQPLSEEASNHRSAPELSANS
jgi:C4-dicarboxylate-specific signal transduction histidine kinase